MERTDVVCVALNKPSSFRSIRLQNASNEVQNLLPGTSLNDALRQRRPGSNPGPQIRYQPTGHATPGFERLPAARPPPGQRPLARRGSPVISGRAGREQSRVFRGVTYTNAGQERFPLSGIGGNFSGNARGGLSSRGGAGFRDRGRGGGRGSRQKKKKRNTKGELYNEYDYDDGDDGPAEYTEAEAAYLKEKAKRDAPSSIAFDPSIDAEDLSRFGPALCLGQQGMIEIVEEKLDRLAPAGLRDQGARDSELVKDVLSGNFVRFKNGEEFNKVIALAESRAKRSAETRSEEEGKFIESKPIEFETLDEDTKTRLFTSWLKGEYALQDSSSNIAVLQHLRTATGRNGSYLPKDQDSIAEKVRSLLAKQPPTKAPRPIAR